MNIGNFIKIFKDNNYEEVNLKIYQYFIEKLMYLSYSTRCNIFFAVKQLSKHNVKLKIGHLKVIKQDMQYLKRIIHLEIIYDTSKVKNLSYELIRYIVSNYPGDPKDCKSIIKNCFFINGKVVSWYNTKQRIVFTSITKAKYIVLGHTIQENIWIRWVFHKLKVINSINTCVLYRENKISSIFTKNIKSQSRIKYINV